MCVFCQIVNGEIPSRKIYEDSEVLAILDISQATRGHTLVIPKKHFENLYDIDDRTFLKVMYTAKKIASHYKEVDKTILGVNLVNNCGEKAGQAVMHFHVHILPRYEQDNYRVVSQKNEYDLDALQYRFKL